MAHERGNKRFGGGKGDNAVAYNQVQVDETNARANR